MPVLDLAKPGKLWATAENDDTATFHLVLPKPEYTKDRLDANPSVNPRDQLMKPFAVPFNQRDAQGRAVLDLDKTGRAKEILDKIGQLYDQGHAAIDKVLGIVVVTARSGNRIPIKHLAELLDFELKPIPHIAMRGVKELVTVQNFKAGQKDFVVEVTPIGPFTHLELSTSPARPLRVEGGPSGNKVTVPVSDGKKLIVKIAAPLTSRTQTRRVAVPRTYKRFVPGGWRRGEVDYRTDSMEEWTGGDVTLRAQGTGNFASINKTIKLRAEAWASGWLLGPPPPPFAHNIC